MKEFCQETANAGIKNGNSAEFKAILLGLIAASLVLPHVCSAHQQIATTEWPHADTLLIYERTRARR
jgi:hypothetical protein